MKRIIISLLILLIFTFIFAAQFDKELRTEKNKANWISIVNFKSSSTKVMDEERIGKTLPQKYRRAICFLSDLYPNDREAIEAVADGIWAADTLGYTVRWHLRYFMDNKYIEEYRKVNRDIAYEVLWQKYETADNDRKKLLYLYSAISTHKMKVTKEIYEEALEGLLTTDISVLRDFLFNELFISVEFLSIEKDVYVAGYSKLIMKKEELMKKHNLNKKDIPEINRKGYLKFKINYPILAFFDYCTHCVDPKYKRLYKEMK